jgi:hypothetical protein
MTPCGCGGMNPTCYSCGGWGYLHRIGEGRASAGATGISPGPGGKTKRYTSGKPKTSTPRTSKSDKSKDSKSGKSKSSIVGWRAPSAVVAAEEAPKRPSGKLRRRVVGLIPQQARKTKRPREDAE